MSVMNFTVTVLRFIIFGAFRRIKVRSGNKAKQRRSLNYNYLLTRRERNAQVSYSKANIYTNIIRTSLDYESKACYKQRFLSVRSRVGFHLFTRAARRRSCLRIATACSIEVCFSTLFVNVATPIDEVRSATKMCRVVIGITRARKSGEIQLEPRKRTTKEVDTRGILRCLAAVSGIDEENCRVAQ